MTMMLDRHDAAVAGFGIQGKIRTSQRRGSGRSPSPREQLACHWHQIDEGQLSCTWTRVPAASAVIDEASLLEISPEICREGPSRREGYLQAVAITVLWAIATVATFMCLASETSNFL